MCSSAFRSPILVADIPNQRRSVWVYCSCRLVPKFSKQTKSNQIFLSLLQLGSLVFTLPHFIAEPYTSSYQSDSSALSKCFSNGYKSFLIYSLTYFPQTHSMIPAASLMALIWRVTISPPYLPVPPP
jgi:hypothetical protein